MNGTLYYYVSRSQRVAAITKLYRLQNHVFVCHISTIINNDFEGNRLFISIVYKNTSKHYVFPSENKQYLLDSKRLLDIIFPTHLQNTPGRSIGSFNFQKMSNRLHSNRAYGFQHQQRCFYASCNITVMVFTSTNCSLTRFER